MSSTDFYNRKLNEYYESIRGKRIYLLGAGISHRELIRKLSQKGALVTLCDKKTRETLGALVDECDALGVSLKLGDGYLDGLEKADIVFRTPGIDYTRPQIQAAVEAGVEVTSEIETFFRLCPCKIIGVTGSDGKTTTTTLVAKMLEAAGNTVHLGGNIGRPLLPIIEQVKDSDIAVVELSSFQLISMRQSPDVAVVTNVAPNHLDHHKDMDEYINAKRNLLLYQNQGGVAVLNAENPITRSMAKDVKGELRWFSSKNPVKNGAYMTKDKDLISVRNGEETTVMNLRDILLRGEHNKENVTTATAAVSGLVPDDAIRSVASTFAGVEHRLEFVREKDGVRWYNDSIGTTPTRTIEGLKSFEGKIILIAGGYDKKISYAPLAPEILRKVKRLILCGPTASVIKYEVEAVPGHSESRLEIELVKDIPEAVAAAASAARPDDTVLLSPASASFDAYPDFEARGRHFKELVNAL